MTKTWQFFVYDILAAFLIFDVSPSNISSPVLGLWSRPGLCLSVVWLDVE